MRELSLWHFCGDYAMRFDQRHPSAIPGFKTSDGFYKGDSENRCCRCDLPTPWFHVNQLLFFCSEECYQGYTEHTNGDPH